MIVSYTRNFNSSFLWGEEKKMKIKIIGILVCILLITTFLPVIGAINDENTGGLTLEDTINFIHSPTGNCILEGWLEQDKLIASDGETYDEFGNSVSIDGDYAIVGSWKDDIDKGSAYIFKREGTSWIQKQKLSASDGEENDEFGVSVSIDGDYAIVGASDDDGYTGSAYVFKREGETWIEVQKLIASDGATGDLFGESVSIDDDYILIGARSYFDNNFGSGYIFHLDGTVWIEEQKLLASDGQMGDGFGFSVSLSGDYALIGARNDDNYRGSAYVFKRDGAVWTQEQKLIASDGTSLDYFGWSVSLSNDYVLIGAFPESYLKGSAYVFKRDGTIWTEQQKLTASDGEEYDAFGWSVCIERNYAIIGATGDDNYKGSTYVFKRDGATWTEVQKLTASDGTDGDRFGQSAVLVNEYILLGATWDSSRTGSAYVFKKPSVNMDCYGNLDWSDIRPGETVLGNFNIENIGESGSLLNWEIQSFPEWGTWTFNPESGTGLTPEDGPFSVELEVIAPDEPETDFTGHITIINSEDPGDYCIVDVSLSTPVSQVQGNQQIPRFMQSIIERYPLMRQVLGL